MGAVSLALGISAAVAVAARLTSRESGSSGSTDCHYRLLMDQAGGDRQAEIPGTTKSLVLELVHNATMPAVASLSLRLKGNNLPNKVEVVIHQVLPEDR